MLAADADADAVALAVAVRNQRACERSITRPGFARRSRKRAARACRRAGLGGAMAFDSPCGATGDEEDGTLRE